MCNDTGSVPDLESFHIIDEEIDNDITDGEQSDENDFDCSSSIGNTSCDEISEDKISGNLLFAQPHSKRTVLEYKEASENISNGKNYEGIKFDFILNKLDYYHVCNPGLCPCCGHDLLEGVVAVDMVIFTQYSITNNWFILGMLNSRIENFKYSSQDKRDKPAKLHEKSKKLSGGAW